MSGLTIWKEDTLSIKFENKKYTLYNEDTPIISNYDHLIPCNTAYIIGCVKDNNSYKYQLINNNGEKIFGDKQLFELISYDQKLNEFNFFNYYEKITIKFPILSKEKNKLFNIFLQKLYNKKIKDIGEFKEIVNKITEKIAIISDKDVNIIIENLELANEIYLRLNKPKYLKNNLIILDKDDEKELLNIINENKIEIFVELTKDIIKNPKIYDLNIEIINNILDNNKVTTLNEILTQLNNIQDSFKSQMEKYKSSRYEIFSSLDSIENYFTTKETIKYFDEKDYNYIKSNRNLFFNIIYNQSNNYLLDLLKKYDITE